MTKGELVKMLSIYDDDIEVKITLSCDNAYRVPDEVKKVNDKLVVIESSDVPNIDDLSIMAEKSLEWYEPIMLDSEKKLLKNLIGEE